MKNIKIIRLEIVNMKVFQEKLFSFQDADFVILDGPNGYGKTSLFDAIELLLTGSIERIKRLPTDHKRKFNEQLLINDPSKRACYIKAELSISGENLILARSFDFEKESRNHPDDFSGFKLHVLKSFKDSPNSKNLKSDKFLKEHFDDSFLNLYNRMHYLEQEESTFYLKRSSIEKRDMLSFLFNIEREESDLNLQEKISRHLKRTHRTYKTRIDTNKKNLITESSGDVYNVESNQEYFRLFEDKNFNWDEEEIEISKSKWPVVKNQLMIAMDICANPDDFRQARINSFVDKNLKNRDLLQFAVKFSFFISEDKKIKETIESVKKTKQAIKNLSQFESKYEYSDIGTISSLVSSNEVILFDNFFQDLKELSKIKSHNSALIKDLSQIRLSRENLKNHIQNHKLKDCLLCGQSYNDSEILIQVIDEKWNKLEKKKSQREKDVLNLINDIQKKYINPLIKDLSDSLNKIFQEYPEPFLESYNPSQEIIDKFTSFEKVLHAFKFTISTFSNKTKFYKEEEIILLYDKLVKELNNLKKASDPRFYEEIYDTTFKDIFDGKLINATKINPDLFSQKIIYIENAIQIKQNHKIQKLKIEIQKDELILNRVIERLTILDKTIPVYRKSITEYKNKIINLIQVPLYVYSGRIIQSFNRGYGFILKTAEEGSKELKFVSDANSEHDAIYSLSSGQLSALVISFMLALHKVYAKNNLIFIDDPVQSMDDINISSLIELLRNDFRDSFVILSTHEDHISSYMDYKFGLAGLKVHKHNLKDS